MYVEAATSRKVKWLISKICKNAGTYFAYPANKKWIVGANKLN
jgi:hypothetical protein